MAKKTRKQKQRTASRRPAGAAPARPSAGPATAPLAARTSQATATAVGEGSRPGAAAAPAGVASPAESTRRRVERVTPASAASIAAGRQQRASVKSARFGTAAAMVEPLDSDDPAIPFDRVPYVPSDLRRVAVIAGIMVILILIAWTIVSHVVD
ncbi:MAG: hypothetical protein ABR950_00795 [Candidatus Dormibacteria bacterium]|jgi:hypothetical protein